MSVAERATIAVGAGLYEELLFRMLMIAGVHLVAADLLGMKDKWARLLAVVCSAAAFAWYHDVILPTGGIDWARLMIFFLAGLYFGGIYVIRGFGIVVATHALYDLAVLILLPSGR
jgi:membrane protease YdiL (CAAX protease family)